jgi:hypothetical protein
LSSQGNYLWTDLDNLKRMRGRWGIESEDPCEISFTKQKLKEKSARKKAIRRIIT